MVVKKDTIDEVIKDLIRDVEKLKEKPKEDFAVFDGFLMAEQMEATVGDSLSDPIEIPYGLICGTSIVGFFEV